MHIRRMLSLLLLLPVSLFAHCVDLAGSYSARGTDPSTGAYTGSVQISEPNEAGVFNIFWWFNDGSTSSGSGVRQDDELSIIYVLGNSYGTQAYKISSHNHHVLLSGPYLEYGDTVPGHETLTKNHD